MEELVEIINIGIATEKEDIAAENETSLNAKTYDTSLGYTGAITYTGENGTYWCYFDQIEENLTSNQKKRTTIKSGIKEPSMIMSRKRTEREESDVDVQLNLEMESKLGK